MNKLTKKILAAAASAAMAASVMAVTPVSLSVYANVSYDTVLNGWVKSGDTERRYENGLPYTGWLNVEDGTKKYCLDGYLVKGSMTIGNKTYSFGKEDGVLSGTGTETTFSAECGEVNPDTNRIDLSVYVNKDDGKQYSAAEPEKMERWVKGKWTDCKDKDSVYVVDDIASYFSYQSSNKVSFFPQAYTKNNLTEGYYRITLTARDENDAKASAKKFYAIFKVTPKNIYKDGLVDEGTLTRRYVSGKPYTGWTQGKNGLKKYYLDGYAVTGELQMDDIIYTFDDEGYCTNQRYPVLSASCEKKISADTEQITIDVYSKINNGKEYIVPAPSKMMRWEYGRWVICKGYDTSYNSMAKYADVTYSKSDKTYFYPQMYTDRNFKQGYYKIDLFSNGANGVIERFSVVFEAVDYTVVKNGWVKEGGTERRYKSGKPYTGWIENSDGTRKYCYDGYAVIGNFQIGKYVYSFNENGIYTGIKSKLIVAASCGDAVATDTQKLTITVTNTGSEKCTIGQAYKMERWENGKWVDCIGNGVDYVTTDLAYIIYGASQKNKANYVNLDFYPQKYTRNNFTAGYYRISVSGGGYGNNIYAVFEVVDIK